MPRFITVTTNPAYDRAYSVADFKPGEVNRASSVHTSAGGKGINVARVLKTLGAEVIATGFLGGPTGDAVRLALRQEELGASFVDISPADTRFAIIVMDSESSEQTVINESGPAVSPAQMAELNAVLDRLLPGADMIVFSGSLAPGMSKDTYARWIELAKRHGVAAMLDSSGEALRAGIKAGPMVVKPNASELKAIGALTEKEWERGPAAVAEGFRARYDVDILAVTAGKGLAFVAGAEGVYTATMPDLDVVSAVGSGDSFAAGLAYSLTTQPGDLEAAIRLAAGCGGANTLVEKAGGCGLPEIREVSGKIHVERLA